MINVAGHRLSTGAMEEILASHPGRGRVHRVWCGRSSQRRTAAGHGGVEATGRRTVRADAWGGTGWSCQRKNRSRGRLQVGDRRATFDTDALGEFLRGSMKKIADRRQTMENARND